QAKLSEHFGGKSDQRYVANGRDLDFDTFLDFAKSGSALPFPHADRFPGEPLLDPWYRLVEGVVMFIHAPLELSSFGVVERSLEVASSKQGLLMAGGTLGDSEPCAGGSK